MIKIENVSAFNFKSAIRGMRNPLESWDKTDSKFDNYSNIIELGENDKKLAMRLIKSGSDERKFLRQIFISMDITAPLYWWKEFDTYKVGTVVNSTSTMHKLGTRILTIDDFSFDDKKDPFINEVIDKINELIKLYNKYKNGNFNVFEKETWRKIIQLLPSSFNQTRTVTFNYENARNMYHARKNHKLKEWRDFCEVIRKLPCSEFITD